MSGSLNVHYLYRKRPYVCIYILMFYYRQYWREEAKIGSILPSLQEELLKVERQIYGTLDKGTSLGLESVRRICQTYQITGVHGPLYELFELDEIYSSSVEIMAGQR